MWPYKFEAKYTVTLEADKLATELCITNTGTNAFDFTAALHSYWSVSSIGNLKISSPAFAGATYLDKMRSPPVEVSETPFIQANHAHFCILTFPPCMLTFECRCRPRPAMS